jgi:hypothetical protein
MDGLTAIAVMVAPAVLGSWSLYSRAPRRWLLIGMVAASAAVLAMLFYRWSVGLDLVPLALGSLAALILGWGVFQRIDRSGLGRRFGLYRHVEQDSPFLHLRIDLIDEQLSGWVKRGQFAGRAFESLNPDQLRDLAGECVGDPASAWLMALSLKLRAASEAPRRFKLLANLGGERIPTVEEALDALGLSPGSSGEEIAATYRRRIAELFLDRSADFDRLDRLDRARAVLLGR